MPILESGLHTQNVLLLRTLQAVPLTVKSLYCLSLNTNKISLAHRTFRKHTGRRTFTVLGFESSADDTCSAVVTSSRQILSNVVVKQHNP
ncbi:hypothetical protein BDR04DRAFT_478676 [Suillus decipiens]|nr:hypothetical protein BDR04DRAFT_478676 [Suillus decipiens]